MAAQTGSREKEMIHLTTGEGNPIDLQSWTGLPKSQTEKHKEALKMRMQGKKLFTVKYFIKSQPFSPSALQIYVRVFGGGGIHK